MTYKKKMISIVGVLAFLVVLFLLFKKDIFYWSCYEEKVYSSCHILASYLEEEGQNRLSLDHFHKACDDGKYFLSCQRLSEKYSKNDENKSKHYRELTCKIEDELDFCK